MGRFDVLLSRDHYTALLGIAVGLELVDGALFVANLDLGAHCLLAFMLAVTPIMHNFWAEADPHTRLVEMIMFCKNAGITGALLFYIGGKSASDT
ncbi:hypothetical protein WJX81_005597 [Elliptochloris bilobata]|uniref:DoxX family protein n=1 Tax=Elliptochloris bilobata TaxID=381761 RepID=A0AAW1S111_9CHLO